MSPNELAAELEVTAETVRRWCVESLGGGRSPLRPTDIRSEEPNGPASRRYWIDESACDRVIAGRKMRADIE